MLISSALGFSYILCVAPHLSFHPFPSPSSPSPSSPTSFLFRYAWMNVVESCSLVLIISVFAFSGECRTLSRGSVSRSRRKVVLRRDHEDQQLLGTVSVFISSALIICSVCDPPFPSLRRLPCPLQPLPIPRAPPPDPTP